MIDFYFGSGSPPAWRVQLTLEHKGLPYTPKLLSFGKGDTRTPEYLAINPRGKVPAIVDDGFALYESTAIMEYLDAKYPEKPVYPRDLERAATARRLIQEAEHYLYPAIRRVTSQVWSASPSVAEIEEGRKLSAGELERFAGYLTGDSFLGELTAADYTVYSMLAILEHRLAPKFPAYAVDIPEALRALMKRVESLPYYDKTYPPHWRG